MSAKAWVVLAMRTRARFHHVAAGFAWMFLLNLCVLGCSGDKARVSGIVKLSDGSPLTSARVTASNSAGDWASGVTDATGQFKLGVEQSGDGLAPGSYQVIVVEDRGDWDNPKPPRIHAKYQSPSTSELELEVEAGESLTVEWTLEPPVR